MGAILEWAGLHVNQFGRENKIINAYYLPTRIKRVPC